jgi:hypothetical protein
MARESNIEFLTRMMELEHPLMQTVIMFGIENALDNAKSWVEEGSYINKVAWDECVDTLSREIAERHNGESNE